MSRSSARVKVGGRGKAWVLDEARKKRVRGMLANSYTVAEMASSLCVSQQTLARRLREAGMHPDQSLPHGAASPLAAAGASGGAGESPGRVAPCRGPAASDVEVAS